MIPYHPDLASKIVRTARIVRRAIFVLHTYDHDPIIVGKAEELEHKLNQAGASDMELEKNLVDMSWIQVQDYSKILEEISAELREIFNEIEGRKHVKH